MLTLTANCVVWFSLFRSQVKESVAKLANVHGVRDSHLENTVDMISAQIIISPILLFKY